jgi:Uma2 family endonuclease
VIPEVWVIDAATRITCRFREPRPEGYAEQDTITNDEPLSCLALPGAVTTLATVLPLGRSAGA